MLKKLLNVKTIIFIILAVGLLLIAPKLMGLLLLLFASYILAAALNPFVNKFEEKIKNRTWASILILLLSILVIFALILPIIIVGIKEVQLLIAILPQKVSVLYKFLIGFKLYGHSVGDLMPTTDSLISSSGDIAQGIVNGSINATVAVFQSIFVALALCMFVFYILVDKQYLKDKFIEFFPPAIKQKAANILHDITTKVGNYVRAQLLSMVAVGLMVALVAAILGIDYPILLGLISGICEIIPVLGPTIAVSVIVAIAFPLGVVKIILAIVGFLLVQNISNYMIRPFLFGKFMKLHPITILVALFVAEEFLGVWGVILSPAIAATVCVLVDELYLAPMNAKEAESKLE
ncbi:MAG: AI-2E family transporter [Cyanobacteriota bacterium]|nr:AI-2E family transporter [Cyanobacteriota bacterium]MDY6358000.1 AI-2E family transporter [Cyanobacteriota bacterium]MDY6364300.1 AI-2E family transporter [Cyanobacteriota bacterium]